MKKNILMRAAFTMCEIIIVFGVLGIIAEYTLPELVDNVTNQVFTTSSAVYLRKLEEAANQMAVADDLEGYSTNEQFADAFVKYVKVDKRCTAANLNQCFVSNFKTASNQEIITSNLTTSADLTTFNNTNPLVGFNMSNGTSIIMAYNPNCVANYEGKYNTATSKTYCMSMVYDTNAFSGPNKMGKDILTLNATISTCDGVRLSGLCIAAGDTTYSTINTCSDTTWDSNGTANSYCATNAWAGAKKACADQGMRLPSKTELDTVYLNKSLIGGGFGSTFYWSAMEQVANNAWNQNFVHGHQITSNKANTDGARCVK